MIDTHSHINFDDYKNTSYFQVLNGVSEREKYRIRYYDYDEGYITLEKKKKVNNLGNKTKDIITKQTVNNLINNINAQIFKI